MRRSPFRRAPLLLVIAFFLVSSAPARASFHQLVTTISIPGKPFTGSDITYLDPGSRTYFLTDRDNKAIDIFDTAGNTFLARIPLGDLRPADVATAPEFQQAIISGRPGAAGSEIAIADLNTDQIVATIPTGGVMRGDEIGYDPVDHLIFQGIPSDNPPYDAVVSWDGTSGSVVKTFPFPGVTNIEQPFWDPNTGLVYQPIAHVPAGSPTGEIVVIDPKTLTVTQTWTLPTCDPHGDGLTPSDHLVVGCAKETDVIDLSSGQTIARIPEVTSGDQVAYNPGDGDFYVSGQDSNKANVLGVIDAATNQWIENIPTDPGADTKVAVDPTNSEVFIPIHAKDNGICPSGCVGVYGTSVPSK